MFSRFETRQFLIQHFFHFLKGQTTIYVLLFITETSILIITETVLISKDESPITTTTCESLNKLNPAFIKDGSGTVTAGNCSSINDGAACVAVAPYSKSVKLGITEPLGRIVSSAQVGIDPSIMGTGPVGAVKKAVSFPVFRNMFQ